MAHPSPSVAGNLSEIRARIERAASRAKRDPSGVTLVAVTKSVSAERVREAYEAGVRDFGENRIQEWEEKKPLLDDLAARWHLVGHLQRNKAALAVNLFHTVDSLDTLPLAEKLDRAAGEGRRLPVLIEVRLDQAPAKSGCAPDELERLAEGVLLMPHLELRGLMTVPPNSVIISEIRPIFRRLRQLRDDLSKKLDWPLVELSMGMSRDLEVAVEEGATQVRVGTGLFGPRSAAR